MDTPCPAPPTASLEADGALLLQAVREAGALALGYFGHQPEARLKPDGTQVSEADLAADAALKAHLLGARPAYGWLSEETPDDLDRLGRTSVWIVDPIDGTRAFLKEKPEWTVSAALVEHGRPVLAAVFNPARDELFSATKGQGARLNGEPIHVSDRDDIAGSRLVVSRSLLRRDVWDRPWPELETIWVNSIAYRLSLIAAGRCDGTLSLSAKSDWDLAAAHLLVHEAGGVITTRNGGEIFYNGAVPEHDSVVAAGPKLHKALLERTRAVSW